MADADIDSPGEDDPETSPDRSGTEASAAETPANETLPADVSSGEAVAEEAVAEEAVPDGAFAEDLAGAEDFSQKALSERTRTAYRRAWEDFETYCEEVGRPPSRPARRSSLPI
jgi:hypothetical protein